MNEVIVSARCQIAKSKTSTWHFVLKIARHQLFARYRLFRCFKTTPTLKNFSSENILTIHSRFLRYFRIFMQFYRFLNFLGSLGLEKNLRARYCCSVFDQQLSFSSMKFHFVIGAKLPSFKTFGHMQGFSPHRFVNAGLNIFYVIFHYFI